MKRTPSHKVFHLPLLASLPALLASCGGDDDAYNRYTRVQYNSYEECMVQSQTLVQQGLQDPCVEEDDSGLSTRKKKYYGPYTMSAGNVLRYVGYTSRFGGVPQGTGLRFDSKKGTYGSFKAPVVRGGLTSSARGLSSAGRSASAGG